MYSALIVDDEAIICKGLSELISWADYGISVVGFAHSGNAALKFVHENSVDMMLLDVSMPHKSGIEVIKTLRAEGYAIKVIIISAFNAFEYVRDALKYGVENYLLKPVSAQELTSTISALTQKLAGERSCDLLNALSQETLMNNILLRYASGTIEPDELAQRAALIGLKLDWKCAALMLVKLYDAYGDIAGYRAARQTYKRLKEISPESVICLTPNNQLLVMFMEYKHTTLEAIKQAAASMLDKLGLNYFATLSGLIERGCALCDGYNSCCKLLKHEPLLPRNSLLSQEPINDIRAREINVPKEADALKQMLTQGEESEFARELKRVINVLNEKFLMHPAYMKSALAQLCLYLFGEINFTVAPANELTLYDILEQPTLSAIEESIYQIATQCVFLEQRRRVSQQPIVKEMILHIQKEYNDGLSLKRLGEVMHFSPAYLGQVFKAEVGVVFSDYLNDYRIDKAKELLKCTTLRTGVIASMVGISNVNYFSNLFKKRVGVYPSAYRSAETSASNGE